MLHSNSTTCEVSDQLRPLLAWASVKQKIKTDLLTSCLNGVLLYSIMQSSMVSVRHSLVASYACRVCGMLAAHHIENLMF